MTEIKPWKQRIENTTLMGPLATYQAMEAEIAELRAALSKSKAELDEWRFTNKIDEMQREIERLSAHVAKSQPVEQGEPVAWFIDVTTNGESTGDWQVAAREHWGDLSICKPLFTHPVRPMTDEQIDEILDAAYTNAIATGKTNGGMVGETWNLIAARAIEAHIKGATA